MGSNDQDTPQWTSRVPALKSSRRDAPGCFFLVHGGHATEAGYIVSNSITKQPPNTQADISSKWEHITKGKKIDNSGTSSTLELETDDEGTDRNLGMNLIVTLLTTFSHACSEWNGSKKYSTGLGLNIDGSPKASPAQREQDSEGRGTA